MLIDITRQFSSELAKKIFSNKDNGLNYLLELDKIEPVEGLYNNRGTLNKSDVWGQIVRSWNYEISKTIIRAQFRNTQKYKRGREANEAVTVLRAEWAKMELGDFSWPFSQGEFDNFVQKVNAQGQLGEIKDDQVKQAAVKFRRIKEINTYRNDYIETLIFEKSETILPTLGHRREVDFFINGLSFDQKVSRSVTSEFKEKYGDNWRQRAIDNPAEVAEFLYRLQDENRFGSDPRLLIVYVDEDISADRISSIIEQTDFCNQIQVAFTFNHKKSVGSKSYSTPCIIVLLHN